MPIKNRFAELLPEITAWRHDFHRHPELQFEVHRTAARVAELCRAFGCDEVVEGIGRTGVVAVIHGQSDHSGRRIGLRADMDALPIHEQTGAAHASTVPEVMHACGHDGHTSMLLGAAKYLAETRNFDGRVVCIFQPAEEGMGGGLEMLRDGLFERWPVDEVYGMHNMPGVQPGDFAIRSGPIMAAADQFDIIVTGKGSHAARPHDGVDPTLVSAQIVTALQTIASRSTDPLAQVVVSVCGFQTEGFAYNVIPGEVRLCGTVRTLDKAIRVDVETRLTRIATGIAETFGAHAEVKYHKGYPPTVNAAEHTDHAITAARLISDRIDTETAPLMAAEDFSYMLERKPGAYIFIGNGDSAPLHHAAYDFDDSALPYGASWYATMAETRLPR